MLLMAKKINTDKRCRDCANSYDPHELNLNGVPFMCKCKVCKGNKFLNRDICDKFKQKL